MVGREGSADFQVGRHFRADRFSQPHPGGPFGLATADAPGQDYWAGGAPQPPHGILHQRRIGPGLHARHEARGVDGRQGVRQRRLLHRGIEVDVDRGARGRPSQPGGAEQRLPRCGRGGGLRVPLHIGPHDGALVLRGMDPVDPGPALGGIHRAGGTQHDHRHAITPGVKDRHGGVEQPDIGVHRRQHGRARHLGPPVREGDRMLLVQAKQHLRRLVAQMVHQAVVQAAIGRTGVQGDERDAQGLQCLGDGVAAEKLVASGQRGRPLDVRAGRCLVRHDRVRHFPSSWRAAAP